MPIGDQPAATALVVKILVADPMLEANVSVLPSSAPYSSGSPPSISRKLDEEGMISLQLRKSIRSCVLVEGNVSPVDEIVPRSHRS